jgi:hypothetical protein
VIVVKAVCVTVCVSPVVEFSVSVTVVKAIVGLVIVVRTVFVEEIVAICVVIIV